MTNLSIERLAAHRAFSFRTKSNSHVLSSEQALKFVNERGYIFFWPVKDVDLPSLWVAVGGRYPVSSDHDHPFHITWRWKDEALDKKIWYYAKILRRKATFIALEVVPYFYALSENYGAPEEDYLVAYAEGKMTQAAKQVYEALLDKVSLDTISLRKEARLMNAKVSEFNRALEDLQMDFKILPVGIAEVGAWRYAYRYAITAKYFPDIEEKARLMGEADARRKIITLYFRSVGAARARDLSKLFGWKPEVITRTINHLVQTGLVTSNVIHPESKGEWLALTDLVV